MATSAVLPLDRRLRWSRAGVTASHGRCAGLPAPGLLPPPGFADGPVSCQPTPWFAALIAAAQRLGCDDAVFYFVPSLGAAWFSPPTAWLPAGRADSLTARPWRIRPIRDALHARPAIPIATAAAWRWRSTGCWRRRCGSIVSVLAAAVAVLIRPISRSLLPSCDWRVSRALTSTRRRCAPSGPALGFRLRRAAGCSPLPPQQR